MKRFYLGEITYILFEDEAAIRDYQAIQRAWFEKGKQRIIPTYGKHQGVKLLGVLNYETGEVFIQESEKYDAEVFLAFLKEVLKRNPNGKIAMILDNSRIHHAKLIQPFLEENKDRLELHFLPPYSPQLNCIEKVWGWLKSSCINNVFFKSTEEIREKVQQFVEEINQDLQQVIDRVCLFDFVRSE